MRSAAGSWAGVLLGCAACAAPAGLPHGATAADCAACHPDHAAAHAASPHGTSGRSPVFVAWLPRVAEAWGDAAADTCVDCHAPGFAGDDGDDGIGCVACHAATGNHGEHDGRLVVDLGAPLAGPLDGEAWPTPAHTSAVRGLLTDPALCGTCHEVGGPGLLVEPTGTEYRASPAAARGEGCVDCHAPALPDGPLTEGTPARSRRDHHFVGMDPPWALAPDSAEALAAASATRALLAEALTLSVDHDTDGRRLVLRAAEGGHAVPTGARFLREIRVEVAVDGRAWSAPAFVLGDQPLAAGLPVPLLTDADEVLVRALDPGASWAIDLPDAGRVEATLRARAVRPEVLEALDLEGLAAQVPDHLVATVVDGG